MHKGDFIFLPNDPLPKDSQRFVIDTNIWLPILGFNDEALSDHYKQYFSNIVSNKTCAILISPLQISEIINAWMRFNAFKMWAKTNKSVDFRKFYKTTYRISSDFQKQYNLLIEDIDNYAESLEFVELKSVAYSSLTNFNVSKLDFNDHYLYLLASQYNAILITEDADYSGLDMNIATCSKKLYQDYKNKVTPRL